MELAKRTVLQHVIYSYHNARPLLQTFLLTFSTAFRLLQGILPISLFVNFIKTFVTIIIIKNCPSARCASAANVVCRDFDVFRNHNVSLEHILL
jgi:hypothetical protein